MLEGETIERNRIGLLMAGRVGPDGGGPDGVGPDGGGPDPHHPQGSEPVT
jgi:hypothetical protein